MSYIKGFRLFRKVLFKPKVSVFILTGIGFMFFTFLTKNNPLELGIAGIASIFIGIGVNNFTALEIEQKDERKLKRKTQHAIETLQHIKLKIKKINEMSVTNPQLISAEMEEMCDCIELCVQFLDEESLS
jgi:hypothetical protein